jgi:predicted RNA-binding Zn ribbon-like protein
MSNSLIDAARAIRLELETILGDRDAAQTLDRQLADLLDVPDPTTNLAQIRQLLRTDDRVKQWIQNAIQGNTRTLQAGYAGIPGDPSLRPSVEIYGCPEPGCTYTWIRRSRAQRIPHCPIHPQHQLILRPAESPTDRPITP